MKKSVILILLITIVFSGCSLTKKYKYTDIYTRQDLMENKSGVVSVVQNSETKKSPASENTGEIKDFSKKVYISQSGKKYHAFDCSYLKSSKIKTTISEAVKSGLTPCSICMQD